VRRSAVRATADRSSQAGRKFGGTDDSKGNDLRSLHAYGAVTASLVAIGLTLSSAPTAFGDPTVESPTPAPDQPPAIEAAAPLPPDDPGNGDAIITACKQFGVALDYAASNYEEFAYATAGEGNNVNYQDPSVQGSNVVGRTALREAAAAAMSASTTPGLPPEISGPMQSWSWRATKMVVIMGLRGGGDSLNATAKDMNTDANNAQMACAVNGGRA